MFLLVASVIFNQNVWSHTVSSSVNTNCTINYNGHVLKDGESIEVRAKFYKMEDCGLHRAYHACGTYLLQMVSIACEVVDQQKQKPIISNRFRRFLRRKLLTEACCETLCTVSEMTRYCP
ncbi:unnamed protein product [Adineta steineri]|uniref:Insulin-like domain-containing protein n=1 Tax=Adineta steineri TaxID=433720 RepID=A0A814QQJ8_9BILA|nr:unnamed protein product [Adineta steineri]CAF1245338.1 unnamed protein product [Adineta steineri]CAF3502873.1 unnamed protein product [Adineta steineri]CAF4016016.1 unnamed protein product [Adineta steineri]